MSQRQRKYLRNFKRIIFLFFYPILSNKIISKLYRHTLFRIFYSFALQFSRLLEKSAESRPSLVEERSTCVQHDKNISIQTEIIAKWNGGLSRILRNIVTPMKRYCTRAWNRCSIRRMNETARVYARVYARGRYATVFLNRERWFRWMDAPLKAIFVSKHRTRR